MRLKGPTLRACIVAISLGLAGAAYAVGDAPRALTKAEATTRYGEVRRLLDADGATCPANQRPVSGRVTGGSNPSGGSQSTTLAFDGGATVRIAKSWSFAEPGGRLDVTIQVSCSSVG